MEVICLEEAAFYKLVEQVVERLKNSQGEKKDKWISDEEAMELLNIKPKTTLQKLRDEGKIRFSQPQKKKFFTTVTLLTNTLKKMHLLHFSYTRRSNI